jgi:hypothetical protein
LAVKPRTPLPASQSAVLSKVRVMPLLLTVVLVVLNAYVSVKIKL